METQKSLYTRLGFRFVKFCTDSKASTSGQTLIGTVLSTINSWLGIEFIWFGVSGLRGSVYKVYRIEVFLPKHTRGQNLKPTRQDHKTPHDISILRLLLL